MEPIAQTFRIENTNGGCFITSIDVYFKTKSTSSAVVMELSPLQGGIPSNIVLARKVKYPSAISISNDASLATKFTFDAPVFVDDGDYAFILKTNSNITTVWVATVGQLAVDLPSAIWKQAAEGQMMISNNKLSWDHVELSDLKYTIRKASFNTGVTGNVIFRNASPEILTQSGELIQTTNTSSTLKIYTQHHGLTASVSKVKLKFDTTAENYSGILASALNGNTYTVTGVGWNWITITAPTSATLTRLHYTSGIAVSYDAQMDRVAVQGVFEAPIGTTVQPKIKTTSGRSISGATTPYVKEGGWTNVNIGEVHRFDNTRCVASYPNEFVNMADANSFECAIDLTSSNPNLSPSVYIDRFGFAAVANIFNNDLTNETSASGGDALAKYVMKSVQLLNPATSLRIMFAANVAAGNAITVYYKIKGSKASGSIDTESWVLIAPTTPMITSTNYDEFLDYTYDASTLPQFTSFKIKVVFTGTNAALVPRIKDFRFIALAI